jgi:crossover junction endodeoxyribonuclease RuvC
MRCPSSTGENGAAVQSVAEEGNVRQGAYRLHVKVLGIDPGTAACGYGIVHESGGRLRAIGHGCWRTGARERPEARLKTIYDGVTALIAEHAPDAVALEESFVGADARIALSVGQARGAVLVAGANAGLRCTEYPPATVKQSVCGYGRADKAQVGKMVRAILGLAEVPAPDHAADALAVAICHALASPLLHAVR